MRAPTSGAPVAGYAVCLKEAGESRFQWTDLSGVLIAIGPATTWATGITTLANGYFTVRCID